jgi:hypothetical protein
VERGLVSVVVAMADATRFLRARLGGADTGVGVIVGVEIIATVYIFWMLYIVYAGAYSAWDKLTIPVRCALLPMLAPFALIDVTVNLTLGSVVFLAPPPPFLHWEAFRQPYYWSLTHRLTIYKNNISPGGWRRMLATWICMKVLDPFQHGHCM